MPQKNATPSKAQAEIIRRAGLNPKEYVVVRSLCNSIIVCHRATVEFKVLEKIRKE